MSRKRTNEKLLKIGEVAKVTGVPLSTIRYYTDIGLLKVATYTKGGYRLYDKEETINIIKKIKPVVDRRRTLKQIKADLAKMTKRR